MSNIFKIMEDGNNGFHSDISFYTKEYSKEELFCLEGRNDNGQRISSYEELHSVLAQYFKDSLLFEYEIEEMVSAESIGADSRCMPINFMFAKNGQDKLAVAILKSPSRKHGAVTGTIDACKKAGIKYIDFKLGEPNTKFYVMRKVIQALEII